MAFEIKTSPGGQPVRNLIKDVHGQTLKLPEVPELEFRVRIASLTGPDLGCFCFDIYDSRARCIGSLNRSGTLWREQSHSGLPTNYDQAIEYIRRNYQEAPPIKK